MAKNWILEAKERDRIELNERNILERHKDWLRKESETFQQTWNKRYELLVKYHGTHGNSLVPQIYKAEDENLGPWVSRQRDKAGILTKEQAT